MKIAGGSVDIGWVTTLSTTLNWTIGVFVGILLLSFFSLMLMRPILPSQVDRVVLKIPFYRDLVLAKQNYIVFFGLGILLGAGLRLEECLRLSRDNSPRGELRDDLERARKTIVGGSSSPWPYVMNTLHPTDKQPWPPPRTAVRSPPPSASWPFSIATCTANGLQYSCLLHKCWQRYFCPWLGWSCSVWPSCPCFK